MIRLSGTPRSFRRCRDLAARTTCCNVGRFQREKKRGVVGQRSRKRKVHFRSISWLGRSALLGHLAQRLCSYRSQTSDAFWWGSCTRLRHCLKHATQRDSARVVPHRRLADAGVRDAPSARHHPACALSLRAPLLRPHLQDTAACADRTRDALYGTACCIRAQRWSLLSYPVLHSSWRRIEARPPAALQRAKARGVREVGVIARPHAVT